MKAMDIIDRADLLEPNQYAPEQKLHWLSTLDGRLYTELFSQYEGDKPNMPAGSYQSGDEELLIPYPYGEDIYYYYLQAMIAAENAETQRYNKRMTMFNTALSEYRRSYHREHMPISKGDFHHGEGRGNVSAGA